MIVIRNAAELATDRSRERLVVLLSVQLFGIQENHHACPTPTYLFFLKYVVKYQHFRDSYFSGVPMCSFTG